MYGKSGSALVLVVALVFFLALLAGHSMRIIVYGADIVGCRGRTIAHDYAVEALLLYGLLWCNKNPQLFESTSYHLIYKGPWFEVGFPSWKGELIIKTIKKERILQALLFDGKVPVATLRAKLKKNRESIEIE